MNGIAGLMSCFVIAVKSFETRCAIRRQDLAAFIATGVVEFVDDLPARLAIVIGRVRDRLMIDTAGLVNGFRAVWIHGQCYADRVVCGLS
jgi:hypothetical protein